MSVGCVSIPFASANPTAIPVSFVDGGSKFFDGQMRCPVLSASRPASESRGCLLRWGAQPAKQRGSVLVIVLWIAFGLVSLALYFANSMNFEMRASDNRVSAMAADQAIEGA